MKEAAMIPKERLVFPRSEGRPPLRLPDGVRMVIWPVIALEDWDVARPMARTVIPPPQGQPLLPDVPNWSWHEYGMRVWFWRLKRMLERLHIAPTVTLNGRTCESYPQGIVALPYNFEIHDIVLMAVQHQPSDALYSRAIDQFECLYEESAERPKIMAIACHPYLSGVPHRIRHVERAYEAILGRKGVVAWDGAHILDWYLGERPLR